jgi:hypothetical protein
MYTSDDSLKNLDSIGGDGGIESADVEAEDLVFKSEDPTPEEQDTESVDSDSCRIRSQEEKSLTGETVKCGPSWLRSQFLTRFVSSSLQLSSMCRELSVRATYVTLSPSILIKQVATILLFDVVARAAFGTPFLHHESTASKARS